MIQRQIVIESPEEEHDGCHGCAERRSTCVKLQGFGHILQGYGRTRRKVLGFGEVIAMLVGTESFRSEDAWIFWIVCTDDFFEIQESLTLPGAGRELSFHFCSEEYQRE